jgi:hypothetical protein
MATKTKPKSKSTKTSNLECLESAGVLTSERFSEDEKKTVEKLSVSEVAVLLKIRKKHGAVPDDKHHLRPNVFV